MRSIRHDGFILPTVLLISIVMIAAGLSLVQVSSSIRSSLSSAYVSKLSTEASDAGIVYANYCYNVNGEKQTWGSKGVGNLTQQTDCHGNVISTYPQFVQTYNTYRSTFSVGDITQRGDGALIVSATGTVDTVAAASPSTTLSTSSFNQKQVLTIDTLKASVSSSGPGKTCGVTSGTAYCWGHNSGASAGQLGNNTAIDSLTPVTVWTQDGPMMGVSIDTISSSGTSNCALGEGSMFCWGQNANGQLGNGTTTASLKPVLVSGFSGKTITAIGTSNSTSCAVTNEATDNLYCWGNNAYGTVGVGSTASRFLTPQRIQPGSGTGSGANDLPDNYTATAVTMNSAGGDTLCAIASGTAYCWGANNKGQVGTGVANTTPVRQPYKVVNTGVLAGKTIKEITGETISGGTAEDGHVCALTTDGVAACWGTNDHGELGVGTHTNSSVPIAVDITDSRSAFSAIPGVKIDDIVASQPSTCALTGGKVYCWGYNTGGQLGVGSSVHDTPWPTAVFAGVGGALYNKVVVKLGGGTNRGCAITTEYRSYCWGVNSEGQIGDGTSGNTRYYPTESLYLRPKPQNFLF